MTPKEQQLSERILDLALASHDPKGIESLVGTYIFLKNSGRDDSFDVCIRNNTAVNPDSGPSTLADAVNGYITHINAGNKAATEALTAANAVNETVAATAKTRKPRGTKPETPAPEPELPPTPEPETVETEVVDPAEDSAEPDKTYAEKIAEGQAAYMAHFKELTDDDAAQRAFRTNTTDLAKKHGGERISKVPEENIDVFLADLQGLIAVSQPV